MRKTKTNAGAALTLVALLGLGVVGCSSPDSTNVGETQTDEQDVVEVVSLEGEWKQTNSNDPESFQTATITADTIEVHWNATDTKSLYWAGTAVIPETSETSFSWDSENDTAKTDTAMLASGDPTKTFTYDDGEISYDVSALGTTMTVRLERD